MNRGRFGPHAHTAPRGYYAPARPPCAHGHCHHSGGGLSRVLRDAAGIALTAHAIRSLTGYHGWGCSGCGRAGITHEWL